MTPEPSEAIIEDLRVRKTELLQAFWRVAAKVAQSDRQSPLTELSRLRADIETIDFAISNFTIEKPVTFSEVASDLS